MSYIEVAKNNFLKKEKDLSEYAVRVDTIKKYVSQICGLLD